MFQIGRNLMKLGSGVIVAPSSLQLQQVRTTIILKRRWQPMLPKKGHKPKVLKSKSFVYEFVEDTGVVSKPNVTVLLTTYVDGLGVQGDEVEVKPNFAYKKLILTGLGVYPTPENKAIYVKGLDESEKEHSSPYVERTVTFMSKRVFAVTMNKEIPWEIEPWHIRLALRKSGIHVEDESAISLPKQKICGPNLDLEGKEFLATVTINNLEKVSIRCRLHHWSTHIKDRLPYVEEHWCKPVEPIFEEQGDDLKNLPALPQPMKPQQDFPQLH